MPRYSYKCEKCEQTFEIFHLMTEVIDECVVCKVHGTEFLQRIPSQFNISGSGSEVNKQTAKQRVDEFINEAKGELEEHKKTSREDYNPA